MLPAVTLPPEPTATLTVPVRPPFRLGLTVAALRRLPANPVERLALDGAYWRAFSTPDGAVAWAVRPDPARPLLHLSLYGAVDDPAPWAARAARVLGAQVDLRPFYARVQAVPELGPLAARMRGVKPPRYPTLWEAFVNAVVFQQVSLAAALAVLRRLIDRFSPPVVAGGHTLYPFLAPELLAGADDAELRGLGLSSAKIRALRALAAGVLSGAISESALEPLPSPEAARRLAALPGIGPWSAAVVLLRGLGRLDVFPAGDSGMAANLRTLLDLNRGDEEAAAARLVAALTPYQGLLYYHLLLARLEARNLLPEE
jgi:DNA-3-methyladenine glycosylase II